MIQLLVTYTVKEGRRAEFIAAIRQNGIDRGSLAEAGNIRYELFLGEDANTILLLEHWRDADAVAFHKTTPHYLKLQELKKEFLDNASTEKFSVEKL